MPQEPSCHFKEGLCSAYRDTISIIKLHQIDENISYLTSLKLLDIKMHTHNDSGMVIANAANRVEVGQ
jgi:isopropylmalate/homocitrate/citramalate synthase